MVGDGALRFGGGVHVGSSSKRRLPVWRRSICCERSTADRSILLVSRLSVLGGGLLHGERCFPGGSGDDNGEAHRLLQHGRFRQSDAPAILSVMRHANHQRISSSAALDYPARRDFRRACGGAPCCLDLDVERAGLGVRREFASGVRKGRAGLVARQASAAKWGVYWFNPRRTW